jgi:hypothetical protein
MRRPPHLGQKPRPLQENATSRSNPQANGCLVEIGGGRVNQAITRVNGVNHALFTRCRIRDLEKYQKRHGDIPLSKSRGYFAQFAAFVCIYPEIHAESHVTAGDHRVRVASYKEIIEKIKSGSISSTWNLNHWRRFAEEHLSLREATLGEATNRLINAASGRVGDYTNRLQNIVGTALPPLISKPESADYGQELITSMLERKNFMLVGASGSAKTFHLHHLALAISARGEELPVLIEARKYRGGDFATLLRQATAPVFRGDPKQLLEDMALCGVRPVLMVDALNECNTAYLPDLIRGIQTFSLQFEARVVLTSQTEIELPADICAVVRRMPLPNSFEKRSIYAYHAGLPPTADLDYFCSGFTNAYDLTIAGRCYDSASGPESRTDLYDRYVRRNLPHNSTIASALLRKTAAEMAKTISLLWPRDTFEIFAEQFLAEQQASLAILDELRNSRLIRLTDDSFTFEHELLFDYFNAEHLRRESIDAQHLSQELRKPRNQDLLEVVLPRFSSAADIALILAAASDADVLCRVLDGKCGEPARSVLLQQCESLLAAAAQDVPSIQITCQTMEIDGRRAFVTLQVDGNRKWTKYDGLLCSVIALRLDQPQLQEKFLDLLDVTEWSIRNAVHEAAKAARFKPRSIWGEAVHQFAGFLQLDTVQIPCVSILSAIRSVQMSPTRYKKGLPIRLQLLERTNRNESHFSMSVLFEDIYHSCNTADLDAILELVQRAWDSNIYVLRIKALHALHMMATQIHETAPERLPRIRQMLEGFDPDNIFVNSSVIDALAAFGGLPLQVSTDEALSEMRSLIASTADNDPTIIEMADQCKVTTTDFLGDRAYGCISNIFEDVFQGVYYEAYCQLSDEERYQLLCLAAKPLKSGFCTDWILRELINLHTVRALPVFHRFASAISTDSLSIQEAVAAFALAIDGCARLSEVPPPYRDVDSAEHIAWKTVGEILFWLRRSKVGDDHSQRIQQLWAQLDGRVALATTDVLYQLNHSSLFLGDDSLVPDLITTFAEELRPILEHCVVHREMLPSLFQHGGGSRKRGVIRFVIEVLGKIQCVSALHLLQAIVDDTEFGKDAIQAIEQIQKTRSTARLS